MRELLYFFKNKIPPLSKYILLFYTFISLLFKCIYLLGFLLNASHYSFNLSTAYERARGTLPYYFSFIILLLSISFLFKNKYINYYLIFINFFVSLLLCADVWYYRGFSTMPSFHVLTQINNLDNLTGSIFSMTSYKDLFFFADILFLMIFYSVFKNTYLNINRSIPLFLFFFLLSAFYILSVPFRIMFLGEADPKETFKIYDPSVTAVNLSPIGYHFLDAYNFWKDYQPLVLNENDKTRIKQWFDNKKESLPDNKYKNLFAGKNLICIQVESLENFVINKKINTQEITPNLNKLIKNSLYFSSIYEQVNEGTSSDSDLMTNTSIYPIRRSSTFFRYPDNSYNSLPLLLKKENYSTLAIHPDSASFWNWEKALTSIGFEKCIDSSHFDTSESIGLGISDGSYLKQIVPILSEEKQPFYTFLVTLTSHGPFDLPAKYRELKLDDNLDKSYLGGYFQSVHYTDKQLGIFIDNLKNQGLLDNTVLVIYGDHCGVHKYYSDSLSSLSPSEDWWFDNHTQIPLIMYQDGLENGEEIKIQGGQIDILPTISYLMGIDEKDYEDTAMGRNLLKTQKNYAVLTNRKFMGDADNEKYKDSAIEGLDLADMIIKSNYFKAASKK